MGRGGKGLFDEQLFQCLLDGRLVALDRQEVVCALLVEDLLRGFILGVQGIGQHDLSQEILLQQQLASGRNFVALGLGNDTAQEPPGGVDRIDDLHPAVTDLLAVDNHDPILDRSQDLLLPLQEYLLYGVVIDSVQEAGKGGLFGTADVSRVGVASKSQRPQLGLAQGVGVLGQIKGTSDHPLGHGHDRQAGQSGHRITQGLSSTKFGDLSANRFHQAADLRHLGGATWVHRLFHLGPWRGEGWRAQFNAGLLDQRPNPDLFGDIVLLIKVLGIALPTGGASQVKPTTHLVGGALVETRIDEGLDQSEGMSPALLPVSELLTSGNCL